MMSWVDATAALLLAVTSMFFVLVGGHGVGMLWMFLCWGSPSDLTNWMLSPLSLHSWAGVALLATLWAPIGVRIGIRWLVVIVSLLADFWLLTTSESKGTFLISALPNITVITLLAMANIGAHRARR